MKEEKLFKIVFLLAGLYNVAWGITVIIYPNWMFDLFGMDESNYPFLMRGIGLLVGLYGYGYWVVSRNLHRYPQLVVIGLLGKVLGPIGWGYFVLIGQLLPASLITILFNDLMWIPFFVWYLYWVKGRNVSI